MWFSTEGICPWSLLSEEQRTYLGTALIFAGILGSATNGWMVSIFCLRLGASTRGHMLLVNTCAASLFRGLLSGFPFTATSALAGRWIFGGPSCKMFAFLHHFFGLEEFLSIVLQGAERLFTTRGYNIGNKTFVGSITLTWTCALAWTLLPIFNFGRYTCDLTAVSCSLDWRPMKGVQLWYNLSYLIFAIGLGVIIIVLSLIFTCLVAPEPSTPKLREERETTKAVVYMMVGVFLLWIPHSILCLSVLFRFESELNPLLVLLAPISNELASLIPAISFMCHDVPLRKAMLMGKGPKERRGHNRRHSNSWFPCCRRGSH